MTAGTRRRGRRAGVALFALLSCVACRRSGAQEALQITMAKPAISLTAGDTATVRAVVTVSPQEAPVTLTWSSDNEAVARVDRSGRVTAIAPGVTGITARMGTAFGTTRVSVLASGTQQRVAQSVQLQRVVVGAATPPPTAAATPHATAPARTAPAGTPPPAVAASRGPRAGPPVSPPSPEALPPGTTPAPVHRSARSPHFSHISLFYTDFYSHYAKPADQAAVLSFLAPRLDGIMGGNRDFWRRANPTVLHFPYALLYTVIQPGQKGSLDNVYSNMQKWYASHDNYQFENAFLHRGGHDAAHRVALKIWDSMRWALNPADEGQRAFQVQRLRTMAQGESGIFLDEYGGGMSGASKKSDEFATPAEYMSAETALIAQVHDAIKPGFLLVNVAEYFTLGDSAIVAAGGGVHLERTNMPFNDQIEGRWRQIDKLMAMGVYAEFVALWGYTDWVWAEKTFPTFSAGMYRNTVERGQIQQLANYYMAVPENPQRLSLDQQNMWNVRPDTVWEAAVEADVGHPREARHVIARGVDPVGQKYRIWARDFDHAYVVVRPSIDWHKQVYGDTSGVVVPLPAPMRPLHRDGTLGPPVSSLTLRDVEAAILFK